jgi:hypothetical protein
VQAGVVAAILLLFGWRFVQHPEALAPTRDPAWYTWRTQLLLAADPELLISRQGPFTGLSGGYRVTTPVTGALLDRIAGIHPYTFTKLLVVALPALTAAALGAFVLRHRRDPLAFLLMVVVAVGLYLTSPFIGYLDNIMALYLLAVALPFLEPARTSWGARSAIGLLVFLASLTHPTTAVAFVIVLAIAPAVRLPTVRLAIREALRVDGPMVAAGAAGLAAGLALWRLGMWGAGAPISDAVLTQPYSSEFFVGRLRDWVDSLKMAALGPLVAAGMVWIGARAFRRREIDEPARMSILWLAPLVGVFGFVIRLRYPYYRFFNTTLAYILLAGTGAWALTRGALWAGRRIGDRHGLVQILAAVAVVAFLGATFYAPGMHRLANETAWIGRDALVSLATVRGYVQREPERPVVLIIKPQPTHRRVWGLAKQFVDIQYAGMGGDLVPRTFVYAGDVEDFVAGRPTVTGSPIFDRISREYLEDVQRGLAAFDRPPVAFALVHFNPDRPSGADPVLVDVTETVQLVRGPRLAAPSPTATAAALEARDAALSAQASPPGRWDDPWHLVRVVLGLIVLLALPGAVAAGWFGVRGLVEWIALVPGLSLGMTAAAAILVIAVHRAPFGAVDAWASAGLATGAAAVARLAASSRRPRAVRAPARRRRRRRSA